jgi:methyl-accepting chemotaxis protein
MKKLSVTLLVNLLLLGAVTSAFAAERGTKAEAKALVEKAAGYIKANGKEKAFVEFSNPKGKFAGKDLYIFAIGFNGVFLAHLDPTLIGKSQLQSKDENVKSVTVGLIETAMKGGGWYDYKWQDPLTKKMRNKSSYIQRVDDTVFIGCGVYK